jgi:hypothetical protein
MWLYCWRVYGPAVRNLLSSLGVFHGVTSAASDDVAHIFIFGGKHMALAQIGPIVIDQTILSWREGSYRRMVVTKVERYLEGDVVLSRYNGENMQVGHFRLRPHHVRALFSGERRFDGDVILLQGPGERTRREVRREHGSLHFVAMDREGRLADAFRVFPDEVPQLLAFCWRVL